MIQPPKARPGAVPCAAARDWLLRLLLCLILAAATLLVYRESLDHHFVTMDDYTYVVENVQLHEGLTPETFAWAMQTFHGSSWFPLTWLSLALDMEFAGLDPAAYHRTNLLLHSANAVLLYLALVGLTRSHWRSFLTAGVFALHPIHVESVAWVAERKDVLSGFFFMLTLWAWARYAERATAFRYLLVPLAATLGLLAKSSLVTLPFVLLLLDFWPLGRLRDSAREAGFSQTRLARALLEKVPLFLVAGVAVVATYWAGASSSALESTERLSAFHRMANAAISYVSYLADSFWPVNLTAFYPHPGADVSVGWAVAASMLLLAITIFAISKLRTAPHLLVGWLWFLGTLVPMIGLVQAGPQARADRFMYLPQTGLCIMLFWSIPDRVLSHRVGRSILASIAAVGLVVLALLSRQQLRIWYDGTTLFEHASSMTRDSAFVHHGLGQAYLRAGRSDDAAREFRAALQLAPRWERPMAAMGRAMSELGEPKKAARWYGRALERRPNWAEIRGVLAESLVEQGESKRAIPHLQRLLAADSYPADNVARAEAHALLGLALAHTGDVSSAAKHYRAALALRPDYVTVHANLGF
ncbi:MAG: tetratricopeptide repeat protein, partial [Deltaproteobacteria bacterium]|nr:tetratricopeptide repeat protein [Deltaproteobacteria bacterium]